MAEQPPSSDRFSEYVNLYYSQLTGGRAKPTGEPVEFPDLPAPKQELGFLGRTVDILSRPMRIISNPVMKAVEFPERMDKVQELRAAGDDAAATKESLSAVGSLLASPFTGFFSDDPANKPYWSDIIEKQSDVANRNDPNYVDVANNVDPKLKGALGFIGDVALDPLWLVPGGWAVKGAATAAKEGPKFTKGVLGAIDVPGAVKAGEVPEAALLPSVGGAGNLGVADSVLARTAPKYDLIIDGKPLPQKFPTAAAAEEALSKLQARSKRPFVNADEVPKVFRGSRSYRIVPATVADTFPAARASQKVADDLAANAAKGAATSSETVIKSLREIIDSKKVVVGGKEVKLKGELSSFFDSLAKIKSKPVKAAKPGKPKAFNSWVAALKSDASLSKARISVPEGSILIQPLSKNPTLGFVMDTYINTRSAEVKQTIEKLLLQPAYAKYKTGLASGKNVDLIGNAATPTALMEEAAEASVAATIVRNLKNLDDAERARGAALLGEELFANLQTMSPQSMSKFLDEIDVILKQTGAIDGLAPISDQSLAGRVFGLFDIDQATRAAAATKVARDVSDIPKVTPESTVKAAEQISENVRVEEDIIQGLTNNGYPAEKINARGGKGREKSLFDAIVDTLKDVLPGVTKNKLDPSPDVYPHISKTGVLTTKPSYGAGVGVVPKIPNTYFQFDLFTNIARNIDNNYFRAGDKGLIALSDVGGKAFVGAKLAAEKERLVLTAMEVAEKFYIGRGVPMTMDLDGVFTNMRFTQAYKTVADRLIASGDGDKWLRLVFFNGNSGMAPTQFMEAVSKVLAGGSREEVKALLTASKSRVGKDLTKVNFLARPKDKAIMGTFKPTSAETADRLTDAMMAAGDDFARLAKQNADEYLGLSIQQGKVIAAAVSDVIMSLMNSPTELATAIRAVAYSGQIVKDFAKPINATQLGATMAAGTVKTGLGDEITKNAKLVDDVVQAATNNDTKATAKALADLSDDAAETSKKMIYDGYRVAEDIRDGRVPEVYRAEFYDDVIQDMELGSVRVPDRIATEGRGTVVSMALKLMDPTRRFFDAKYGMHTREMLWGSRLFFASGNQMALASKPFLTSLKNIMRNNDYAKPFVEGGKETVLQRAFKNVQAGTKSPEGTVLRKAEDDLRPMMSRFFDQTDELQNVLLGNAFFRTGAGREAINLVLDYNSVLGKSNGVAKTPPSGLFFDEDLAVKAAAARLAQRNEELIKAGNKPGRTKPTPEEINQEMFNQWKTWDIEDPIGFMYAINRAMMQLSFEVSFVTSFKQKAMQLRLASMTPQSGFVKIVPGEKSRYGKFLGDEPLYMDPDAAEMFNAIDNFASSTKQFEGGFGRLTRTVLDPVTDTWKYAITLPRPGHHIRNMIGDLTLTFLAEGTIGSVAASTKAWQMMAFRGSYSDIDMAKALTRNGITDIPKNDTVVSSGELGSFTAEEIFEKLFLGKGILIPARQREGLMNRQGFTNDAGLLDDDIASNTLSRTLETAAGVVNPLALRGGKIEDGILSFAEGRDAYVRIQHALQMLEKAQKGMKLTRGYGTTVNPKKISQDELFDVIAERVSKYHPDMATLSIQEKKYLRRIMPFYHWNRGAVQAVSETLLMNPGRVVALNKASYNVAVAAGINPDSLYDPFPDDQLFPSFLQEQMEGPQFEAGGRYYGFRPGIASFDVMNQFASGNPIDTVLDNANPLFKIPIELMTGTRLGTQSRIRDYSDYIDSNIPGLNYAANISGQSVTGSFYSLLTRGGMDPQYQFELGNKDSNDQLISAINWLTGVGLTDYSRPSYIRFAQIEQQQANQEGRDF
jgi:hypothetical protein